MYKRPITICLLMTENNIFSLLRFFFQAEDGIRYRTVTGVQTCALTIFRSRRSRSGSSAASGCSTSTTRKTRAPRSEERRVGKELRSRWSPDHEKKKPKQITDRLLDEDSRILLASSCHLARPC